MLIADSSITTHFKQRHQLDLSITYSNSENFNLRNHVRKRKKHPIGIEFSTDGFNTCCFLSASKPVSTADGDGVLTSSFSVSFLTTNTNVSTSTTAPTTSQVATENSLSMMAKSVASLVDTLTRFVEGQKRASSGISIRQSHQSRSRYRNHYSYYRRSYSWSPRRFSKCCTHYYGYQYGCWSPCPDLSLNGSKFNIDEEHKERYQYRDDNEEDEQQAGGNHEDVGNIVANSLGFTEKLPDFGFFLQILHYFRIVTDFSRILKK